MPHKREYDVIIPIGMICMTTYNLRANKLQRESLPFDWIYVPSISKVAQLLETKFDGFMKKENLFFVRNNGDADIYRDKIEKIEFWHDFMTGEDFEEAYKRNYQKYQRRIHRLFYRLKRAKKILFVKIIKIDPSRKKTEDDYLFETKQAEQTELFKELESLQKIYPQKTIDLLLFYMYSDSRKLKEYDVGSNIHICEMYNNEDFGWQGDKAQIASVLKNYKLTTRSKILYALSSIKYKTMKTAWRIAAVCGSQASRRKLKQKD